MNTAANRAGIPLLLPESDSDVEDWQERALCAQTDPESFFPEKGGSTRDAKKVCASCEVRTQCLKAALDNDERFGIWGGLSERERRKLKRQLASATPTETTGPVTSAKVKNTEGTAA